MSNFLLGLVGAAVGSVFGMPALGFTVGAGLGSVFGHHHTTNVGAGSARLSDLKVQTSTYGVAIARVYGAYRLTGNIIWATPIVERRDKNGHYTYFGRFALGLCAGTIVGIRRLWADGKLLLTPNEDAPHALLSDYPTWLRLYRGDETQTADPLIVTQQGAGPVPGFRGLAYLVFEEMPLAAFNNRLPTISVEVVQAGRQVIVPPAPAAVSQPLARLKPMHPRPIPALPPEEKFWIEENVPLAAIITDLCVQAGSAETIDTSALTENVAGFALAQKTSAREALRLLQHAYFFDVIESRDQLKCVLRGSQSPLAIPPAAVGACEEGEQFSGLLTTRAPVFDYPSCVTVLFSDKEADYATATQTAQRAADTTCAEQVELPLALTAVQAAHCAEVLLRAAWAARTQFAFALSRSYAFLEPSDVIIVHNQVMRITGIDYGSPGLLKIKAVEEVPGLYKN